MHFCLVDAVLEQAPGRIVTVKQVSAAEEYLQDHFPTFPVLPGVMMVEAMVQAARLLAESDGLGRRLVLGSAKGIKYGAMVRPGERLRVEVTRHGEPAADGSVEFKASGTVSTPGDAGERTAVSGRLTLRPVRPTRG
jgi:3-hydroxyacyl-[acyl-carrier-protein] dehydratase